MNMGHGLSPDDPTVTSAFRTTLDHQFLVVLVLAVILVVVGNSVRTARYRRGSRDGGTGAATGAVRWPYPEPAARRLLRISFGVLWIVDGLLQTQTSMPLGLPSGVITPSAASSPGWVQHLVAQGVAIWNDHPVSAAASTVWIQVGIGLLLLVAPRGRWSRAAGLAGAGWGLVVWVFGESFGGVFGHGSSWLFGSPGAAVFYVVAGALVALPDATWESDRLGRIMTRTTGAFFVLMGVVEALPGRGFWSGATPGATPGSLVAMARQMSQMSQPAAAASWERWFGTFDGAHGWAVNFVVVVLLCGVGACLLTARPRLVRVGVLVGAALSLVTWVLVQDLGFLGGVGTDPNSMIPLVLVLVAGDLALVRPPVRAILPDEPAGAVPATGRHSGPPPLLGVVAAVGAIAVVLVGAVPMTVAAVDPNADPILAQALDGAPNRVDGPAPAFTLVDQHGSTVSLGGLAGRTVVLTFLDPTCTSDCPLIAQELRVVDHLLGADAARVEMVAVVNNPLYTTSAATTAFDRQEGMDQLANWHFATGPLPQLQAVWNAYGVQTAVSPAGAMVAHSDLVYVIDAHGHLRVIMTSDPGGPGDAALHASFSSVLTSEVRRVMGS